MSTPARRHVLIEVWQPNEKWAALPAAEKRRWFTELEKPVQASAAAGIEVVGWGALDRAVSKPAAHGFCGVFFVRDRAQAHELDAAIRASGWYEYFDWFNVCAELDGYAGQGAADVLCRLLGVP